MNSTKAITAKIILYVITEFFFPAFLENLADFSEYVFERDIQLIEISFLKAE